MTELSNQIRGLMKTFGLVVPKGAGRSSRPTCDVFSRMKRRSPAIVVPLLELLACGADTTADLDRQLLAVVRENADCRRLMTIPGVGAIVAASFVAAVETPENFRPRAPSAPDRLTPRRYQSGEVDYDGHISRRGDARLRALLYEAATTMLTRVQGESDLRRWGLALKKRLGSSAPPWPLARKLAVVMHAMWKTGTDFNPRAATSAGA